MSLKQPNSGHVYTEIKGSGTAMAITEMALVNDVPGYLNVRALVGTEEPAARFLDNGVSYATHAGVDNPTDADELRMVDIGGAQIITYE